MPNYTNNLNLIKPKKSENYDIDEVTNKNMDIIDTEIEKKVNKIPGKGLSTNDFTNEFIKLIKQMAESKKGVTFYPKIDSEGNLSWDNDGTLDNPTPVNIKGQKGIQGETGPANTISIGTVSSGTEASATITGNAPNQTLNLVLPKGDKGEAGEGRGIERIEETSYNAETGEHVLTIYFTDETTYNFSIYDGPQGPQGLKGDTGAQGIQGLQGPVGPTNTLSIGTVSSGNEASAIITGSSPNQILNLVLPKGEDGVTPDMSNYVLKNRAATDTILGLVKASSSNGIQSIAGNLYISKAQDSDIDNLTNSYKPIVPSNLQKAGEKIKDILNLATMNDLEGLGGSSETVLYEGNTTTDFTLNDKISNYKYIDIYYYCSHGYYCQTMLSPGMYVMDIYINCTKIYPNGGNVSAGIIEDKFFATMEVSGGDQVTVKTNGRTSSGSYTASNNIVIKKVVGRN